MPKTNKEDRPAIKLDPKKLLNLSDDSNDRMIGIGSDKKPAQ